MAVRVLVECHATGHIATFPAILADGRLPDDFSTVTDDSRRWHEQLLVTSDPGLDILIVQPTPTVPPNHAVRPNEMKLVDGFFVPVHPT